VSPGAEPSLPEDVVQITPKRVLCPCHGEHLRAQWPSGFAIVAMGVVQAALANGALVRAIDLTWDGQDGTAAFSPQKLNALSERKPLCYFVDDDTLRRVFREAGILKVLRCDHCGVPRDAGPYTMLYPDGSVREVVLCLECMLHAGRRLHEELPDGVVWDAPS
jgi:hypothetical protein